MTDLQNYIKPELLILIPVLYVIGLVIKKTALINDKYIPLMLGLLGILLSFLYVVGTESMSVLGIFVAITQGVLVTGVAVYVNQLFKQSKR